MFKKIKNLKFAGYLIITIILTLGFSISLQSLLAEWTAPTASPPNNNVLGLLNQGVSPQAKIGSLTIGGAFKADSGDNTLVVDADNDRVGIGIVPSAGLKLEVYGKGKFNDIELGVGSIDSSEILDESITASDLAANSVGSSEVIDNSLTANDLAANSVGSSEVANNSLTASDLAANSVGSSEVANNSLTASDLAANSVGNSEMIDNPSFSSITLDGVHKDAWPSGGYVSGGLYGHCSHSCYYSTSYFDCVAKTPAYCNGSNQCSCPTGYSRLIINSYVEEHPYMNIYHGSFSCYKN